MRGKYDIGILVLCVAFALASLGAVGGRGRTRAKEAVCRSHLRQWASVFDSFTQDHDSLFFTREPNSTSEWWIDAVWPYHEDAGLLLCPSAPEFTQYSPITHSAWAVGKYRGSYGLNAWVSDLPRADAVRSMSYEFVRTPRVWHAEQVPVLADMFWPDAFPRHTDIPPLTEQFSATAGTNEMQRACINRHDGAINLLFMDWSVRKAGLKELWTCKWHKQYNTAGPWTAAGGVTAPDWPEWMRQFKEFYSTETEYW